jgi:STE24 endopeptidase
VNQGKATRYHRLRRRTRFLAAAGGVVVLVSLLASGASVWIRDTVTLAFGGVGGPWAWRHAGMVALYAASVWVLLEGVLLPLHFFQGFVLERRYELSRVGAPRWLAAHLVTIALSGVLVAGAAVVVSASRAFWPTWWWGACGIVFALATILLTNLAPVYVIPLFYPIRPVTRARLTDRFSALAAWAGVREPRVVECVVGPTTRRAQASLVGLGPTRQIVLSDTLLSNYSDDEIEAVLAHELGHHVHRDVWQLIAFELSVVLVALPVGGWTASRLWGAFELAGPTDVAALPLLGLGAAAVVVAATPLGHALSRRQERRADRFAIRATRNPAAFVSSLRRLGTQNLAEDHPTRLVELLCYGHPPLYRRLAAARRTELP